ncbi:thrombospondin [Micromonospora sp. NPDC050495]|uniref:thrombospondin n=1 Tax=Micromonospora sp. NPDC050495 TaxID=3154936 RepID=UPI0033CA2FB1
MKILSRRNGPARNEDVNGDGVVDARDGVTAREESIDRDGVTARDEATDRDGVAARDEAADRDRATARDEATARDGEPVVTDRDAERTTYRSGATAGDDDRTAEAERRAADRAAAARAATGRPLGAGTTRTVPPVDGSVRTVTPADDARTRVADDDATRTDRRPDPAPERTVDLDRDGRPDRPADRERVADQAIPVKKPRASLLATLGLIVSVVGALFVLTGTLAGYGIGLGAVGAVLAVLGLMATRRRHVAGKTDALIGVAVGVAAVVLGIVAMTGQFDWPTTDGDWVGRFREWLDSQFANWF